MKVAVQSSTRGFALIIVMLVIVVFSGLAAVFAMSMKVEMQLARNVDSESEIEWLGRSGVELARYVLAQQLNCPNEPYDALNQKWAGGPGGNCSSNGPLADISLDQVQLGRGKFWVKISDLERKVNINFANREMIQQALDSMGVELFTASTILDSIEDWRDPDRFQGREMQETRAEDLVQQPRRSWQQRKKRAQWEQRKKRRQWNRPSLRSRCSPGSATYSEWAAPAS